MARRVTMPVPPSANGSLYLLGLLSALKALCWLVLAQAVAAAVVGVIAGAGTGVGTGSASGLFPALAWGAGAAVARALVVWASQVVARRTALGAKEELRRRLAERLVHNAGTGAGAAADGQGAGTVLATRGLDALDNYYTQFLPALVGCAVVPLLIGARILLADWVSAVIIVLTVPLVPLFMVLIGWHTRDRVERAAGALATLSNHLVELAKGLPVLVGLGRARAQTEALRRVSEEYRVTTMATLRVAFLSALALELIATLSVAVVAVFIGIRLVQGGMGLETGLLVLILAAECYLPLRELGTAHHASDDGREAMERARRVLDAPVAEPLVRSGRRDGGAGAGATAVTEAVVVRGLTVRYADRSAAALESLDLVAPAGWITGVAGPSSCGKSTLLKVLAGLVVATEGTEVRGEISGLDPDRVAWVPQHPVTAADTVRGEMALYGGTGNSCDSWSNEDARHEGAAGNYREDSARTTAGIDSLLDRVGIGHLAGSHPAELSPGELRRLAVARALARVDAGATVVLLDEPTAHLDSVSAGVIEEVILSLRGRATVILVAHNATTLALAEHMVRIGGPTAAEPTAVFVVQQQPAADPTAVSAASVLPTVAGGQRHIVPAALRTPEPPALPLTARLRLLASILEPWRPKFLLAVLAGVVATLASLALTGLSGWLIVRASQQPPILYLLVAIVGVRFFGLMRAVARYGERLWLHDAVFAALTRLRVRVWEALSRRALSRRSLLRGEGAVDHLIGDLDAVRDLAPRVVLPPVAGLLAAAAVLTTTALLLPQAVALQLVVLAGALLLSPASAVLADRSAARAEQVHRSTVIRTVATLLNAAADLRANRVEGRLLDRLRREDHAATAAVKRSVRAQGLSQALLVVFSCLGALGTLAVGAPVVAAGTLRPEVLAALVLLNLSLADAFAAVSAAVQLWPALDTVLVRFAPDLLGDDPVSHDPLGDDRLVPGPLGSNPDADPAAPASDRFVTGSRVKAALNLAGVTAGWPDSVRPVFSGLSTTVRLGEWLTVTGPSGSGKSTLLAVMLGFLKPVNGQFRASGRIAWCPQQGHLFDSSLRANLLLARPRSQAPSEAQLRKALDDVGLGPLLAGLPRGLDTRLGPEGSHLSGGQRQRVAVARTLLTGADVLLLDEPTAHLDSESAQSLMADLRYALSAKAVVLVTHDEAARRPGDTKLVLG